MKRLLLAALLPVIASIVGCNAFNIEADQPMACLTMPPQTFPVVAPSIPGAPGTFSGEIDLGISAVLPDFLVGGSPETHILNFQSLSVTLDGPPGASFVWLTGLEIVAQKGTTTPVLLVDYTPGSGTIGSTITANSLAPGQNLIAFLNNGGLAFSVSGTYDPRLFPSGATTWTGTITACFSAKVKKTFQEMIDGK